MADEQVLTCYYCDNAAEAECPTCGRLYCGEHGDDVCLRCMSPEAASPSAAVYRGSVVALVIASLITLFLIVRPPESKSATNLVRDLPTATPAVSTTATPTKPGGAASTTPRTGTQVPSSVTPVSPTAEASQSAVASPTASGRTYVMKAGDTLSAVAASFGVTVDQLLAANPGVSANTIAIGTEIKIP
ncbi:MAG: LysM peptidoglycan-binding domain-containing protein [bacterium]